MGRSTRFATGGEASPVGAVAGGRPSQALHLASDSSRTNFTGAPRASVRSGTTLPSATSACAPTRAWSPITAWSSTTAFMPTRAPSPTRAPVQHRLVADGTSDRMVSGAPIDVWQTHCPARSSPRPPRSTRRRREEPRRTTRTRPPSAGHGRSAPPSARSTCRDGLRLDAVEPVEGHQAPSTSISRIAIVKFHDSSPSSSSRYSTPTNSSLI